MRKVWNGKIHHTKNQKLKNSFLKTIVLAGLLVGSLDIIAALVQFYIKTGKDPLIVLKYIASAIIGKDAYPGGNKMAAMGLLLHFLVALAWTLFFFLIYPKLKLLSVNRVLTGIVCGIFIWAMMSYVILPMTKVPPGGAFNLKQATISALILIGAIGLPLSFMAYKYYKGKP